MHVEVLGVVCNISFLLFQFILPLKLAIQWPQHCNISWLKYERGWHSLAHVSA